MLNKVIASFKHPLTEVSIFKYLERFKVTAIGGVEALFTTDINKAQRFGPEATLIANGLQMELTDTSFIVMNNFSKMDRVQDEKDYTTVDIAVVINSSSEVSSLYKLFKEKGHTYDQDMGGYSYQIGHLEQREIWVTPRINVVDNVRVLYVESTSDVICVSMVEKWIKKQVGKEIEIVTSPDNLYSYMMHLFDTTATKS